MQKHDRICQQLATIVNSEQVQPWNTLADFLQDQISQAIALNHTPACIVYPQTQDELAAIVACTHENGWTILPCGNATKLHWGGLAESIDVVISTARLTQIIEHAVGDLTITVEAGLTFDALQQHLAPLGQWLPLDPSYSNTATIGGILATADAGVLRQRYGGARDMVIGISMVRSDGALAKAGGRVVKNVAGYDLMKLLTGSWGTLGIISQVTLRLYPQQPASQTVYVTGATDAIQAVTASLFASSLTPTATTVLSPATAQCLSLWPDDIQQTRDRLNDSLNNLPHTRSTDLSTAPLTLAVRFQSISVSIEQQVEQVMTWAKQQGIQGQVLNSDQEAKFWHQLHTHMDDQNGNSPTSSTRQQVTCKVGVAPSQVVSTFAQLNRLYPGLRGWLNTGNGLGMIQIEAASLSDTAGQRDRPTIKTVKKMRSLCQSSSGFLSLFAAPQAWKEELSPPELWGYMGNAQPVMARLKQQFDPKAILSPGRFLV